MRFLAVVILALCAGCRSDRISGSTGELSFVNKRVEFPRTVVGYPTSASIEILNGGRTVRAVTLTTTAPFSLQSTTFEVPGGMSVKVEATFDPAAAGEIEELVKLESGDQVLEATLAGPAELPPACADKGACWHQTYDHATGSCVQVNEPDASACSSGTACLLNSQCIEGECVGTAKDCDDHDACTTDACDAAGGCIHFSATAKCGASSNACQAPACDPVLGCTFTDAPDGTSCGPSDCSTADICLLGQCKTVSVSDGAACGTQSPCQARGLCSSQVCVRPPAAELTPRWTVWAPAGRHVLWDSIADRYNNIYWREVEADYSSAYLVSVTSAGFKRFSVPIPSASQMALIEDVLVIRYGATLEARSVSDGSLEWTKTFPLEPGVGLVSVRTLARGPAGILYVGLIRMDMSTEAQALVGSGLAALSLVDGATQWEVRLPQQQVDDQSTPVDETGYLYAGTYGVDGKRRYYGLTPQGQIRWAIENPHANPAATFGGRVYHWDHWLSETSSGKWVNTTPPTLFTAGYPRLALGAVSYVGTSAAMVPNCAMPDTEQMGSVFQLVRVDPATSKISWTKEIAGPTTGGQAITNTILTSRSTVLYSQPEDFCQKTMRSVLREISAAGELNFTCQLPGTESYVGEGLLNDGRWVASVRDGNGGEGVRAIDLPGFELPAHGWSTAWGSPARDNHAR
jgi:hypothetical protein